MSVVRRWVGRPPRSVLVDDVMAVASLLWPDRDLSLVRRPGPAPRGSRDFLLLPSLRRPRLLLPAESAACADTILRQDPGQRFRRASQVLAWMQRRGLLRWLHVHRLRVRPEHPGGTVVEELRRVLGRDCDVVVRLGRRRTNRSVVLRPVDPTGRTLAYVKCAHAAANVEALRRERANLETAAGLHCSQVVAPRVLYAGRWGTLEMLAQEPLAGHFPGSRAPAPVGAMRALAMARGVEEVPLAKVDLVRDLEDAASRLRPSPRRDLLCDTSRRACGELGDVRVPVGCWHGDWAPWNMSRRGDQILLWDWEHFADGAPLGFDVLHYRAQQLRMFAGVKPSVEDRWVREGKDLLATQFGLSTEQSQAVILAYLLEINLRFLRDRDAEPGEPPPRRGWGISLAQRLLTGSGG